MSLSTVPLSEQSARVQYDCRSTNRTVTFTFLCVRSGYGDITVLELFELLDEPYTPIMGRLYEQLIRE